MAFQKGKSGHQLKEKIEERWLTSTVEPRCPLVEKIPAVPFNSRPRVQGRLHRNAWIFRLTKLNGVFSNCIIFSAPSAYGAYNFQPSINTKRMV